MNDESRPSGAAFETTGKKSALSLALDGLDDIHAAWCAGYDLGLTHGQRMAAEHLAQELLHRQAAEMAGVAVRTARQRHGNGWADEILRQAEGACR